MKLILSMSRDGFDVSFREQMKDDGYNVGKIEPGVGVIRSDSGEIPLFEFPTPEKELFGQVGKINKGELVRYVAQVKITGRDGAVWRFGLVKPYQFTLIEGDNSQSQGPNIIHFEGQSIMITPRWAPIPRGAEASSKVNRLR